MRSSGDSDGHRRQEDSSFLQRCEQEAFPRLSAGERKTFGQSMCVPRAKTENQWEEETFPCSGLAGPASFFEAKDGVLTASALRERAEQLLGEGPEERV